MVKFREIIRLHELGYNQSEIAQSCAVARSTVQDYIRRASAKSLSYAELCQLSDSEAQARLGKGKPPAVDKPVIDFASVHRELQGKGVTLALLWQEGLDQERWQLSYGQFCRRYNQWKIRHNLSMRQSHRGGEEELTRVLEREDLLWAKATKVTQKALSKRLLNLKAVLFKQVFHDLLAPMRERARPPLTAQRPPCSADL